MGEERGELGEGDEGDLMTVFVAGMVGDEERRYSRR